MSDTIEYIQENRDAYLEELFELLAVPSVSTTGDRLDGCAELVADVCRRHGLEATLVETVGNPIVYAERIVDESKPTVVFYGHYDVQPPGDEELWDSPPFDPTIRDGSIYARGSGDNKGQFLTHVFATGAVLETEGEPSVNVKLLIEGEEESGSTGLIEYLEDDPSLVADADLVYVADGPAHQSGRPTLIYGNRGILSVEIRLREANTDLHSGNFGGPIPNAAWSMVELLGTMRDSAGGIAIEGFHEDVDIPKRAREMVAKIPVDAAGLKTELDLAELRVDPDRYYESLLLEPTLTINGLESGYTGRGKKTIVPHEATAKLDMRLVPDQSPETVFERVREHVLAHRADADVEIHGTFPPMSTSLDTPFAETVYGALSDVWSAEPVELPLLGGSLPAAYLQRELGTPVLVVPYANPDQGNHSPNEHLDVDWFENGIGTTAMVLKRLGRVDR